MTERVLIVHATRAGSTPEVAAAISETLSGRGFAVDVKPVKEKPTLEGYQAVILGSAIRMGAWLPEMTEFIKSNQAGLGQVPTAMFTVHMLNRDDSEASRQARQSYTVPVRLILNPTSEAFFAGKMDFSRLFLPDRLISKMVKAVESDERDWEVIRNWAKTLFSQEKTS